MLAATEHHFPLLVALFGGLIVVAAIVRSCFQRAGIPSLVGFLLVGLAIQFVDYRWPFLSEWARGVFELLGKIGVICLLFRVGLESDVGGLVSQLRRASVVWIVSIAISGVAGYAAARYLLGMDLTPSLFVGVAMTATSVGVPLAVWREADQLKSDCGELLLDVAEMDDISGVVLMAMLFGVAELLQGGVTAEAVPRVAATLGWTLAKLVMFGGVCWAFSQYVEPAYTRFFERLEKKPDPMITVAGTAFAIAALAGLLGFSVAIGAFFAGLVFSRDPEAVKMEASFAAIYDLFVPFFFIGIGLMISIGALGPAVWIGLLLAAVAIGGKLFGSAGPAWPLAEPRCAVLVGVSMVPRAEITMIIMQTGRRLGDWAVPPKLFGGMVMVTLVTCLAVPLVLRRMLQRWPEGEADSND